MVEFVFKGVTFQVKLDAVNYPVYRDKAHLGGPWSDAIRAAANKSLDLKFRRSLQSAIAKLS